MSSCQKNENGTLQLTLSKTKGKCSIGEKVGAEGIRSIYTPVISCEGACIRGEIARLAANYISKEEGYSRGCHGELFTVPDSKIARWIKSADRVVCIDGCFLKCHSRILENIIDSSQLLVYDALSYYKKYNDIFDIDDVPEEERKRVAWRVGQWVLESIKEGETPLMSTSCRG